MDKRVADVAAWLALQLPGTQLDFKEPTPVACFLVNYVEPGGDVGYRWRLLWDDGHVTVCDDHHLARRIVSEWWVPYQPTDVQSGTEGG